MSREIVAAAVVAFALAAVFLASLAWLDGGARWLLGGALVVAFVVIAVTIHLAVFRPVNQLVLRSRQRLGERYAKGDPRYRNETRELSYLVSLLIAIFNASEDKEWVSQAVREDLSRAQALNRQLMDVGQLGREMNSALPYRETVDRVLSSSRSFLRADFSALLLLDEETSAFSLEGVQGVHSPGLTPDCCADNPDCPVRQAIATGKTLRIEGHTCGLFPHTMVSQVIIPIHTDTIGNMGLLITATSTEHISLVTDDVLAALQDHVQSALASAYKYDAIRRQVVTDHLTHLYNRRFFMNRAEEEIDRALRHKTPLSVLMVDIDHFKQFNDTYGHTTGDHVLQTVARALQAALRTSDVCARYGGEEFAVLLPATAGENAYYVAERVRRTLQSTRYTGLGLPLDASITISIGAATCPRDATTLDDLIQLADEALYEAKHEGRDRVVLYHAPERQLVRAQ